MSDEKYDALITVLDQANLAFSKCTTADDICHQAVVFARQVLGFDRAGILLLAPDGMNACGVWGTNTQGEVVEEKDLCLLLSQHPWLQVSIGSKGVLIVRENARLTFYQEPVGDGWNAVVSLWDEGSAFGWLSVDNVISGGQLTELKKAQLVMFGSMLAQWYKRRNAEFEWRELQKTLEHKVAKKTEQLQNIIAQLESTQSELASQEKALSYFTAGVAHEINSPLGYIRSNLCFIGKTSSQLITSLSEKNIPSIESELLLLEGFDEVIDESVSGLDRVSEIIKLLQPLNKLVDEQPQIIDLSSAIDFLVSSLSDCEKIQFIKPSSPCRILVPLQVLMLALESLLNNALYAIRDKESGSVYVYVFISAGRLTITVLDNGEGIPEQHLKNIFQPFYSTKPVGSGVGLGLSISDNLLRLINGQLIVRSEQGHYTFATIQFPIEVLRHD